jgi:uncharacterized protein (DUF2164 family)
MASFQEQRDKLITQMQEQLQALQTIEANELQKEIILGFLDEGVKACEMAVEVIVSKTNVDKIN